jgi:hypothetical protein
MTSITTITTITTMAHKAEALAWLDRRLDWEDRLTQLRGHDAGNAEAVRAEARTA